MKRIGMQAVDDAIKNGIDLDGNSIPPNARALKQDYE